MQTSSKASKCSVYQKKQHMETAFRFIQPHHDRQTATLTARCKRMNFPPLPICQPASMKRWTSGRPHIGSWYLNFCGFPCGSHLTEPARTFRCEWSGVQLLSFQWNSNACCLLILSIKRYAPTKTKTHGQPLEWTARFKRWTFLLWCSKKDSPLESDRSFLPSICAVQHL